MRTVTTLSLMSTAFSFQAARFGRMGALTSRLASTMPLREGDSVPHVVFKARVRDDKIAGSNPFTWKDVSTTDLFKGKKSVIFALPGGTSYDSKIALQLTVVDDVWYLIFVIHCSFYANMFIFAFAGI